MTKKELLKEKFEEFRKLKFPSEPAGMDIIAELSYDDGYIVGNVDTFLGQASINHPLLGIRKEIYEQLEKFQSQTEEEKKDLDYIKFYVGKLDELSELLKECLDEIK